MTPAEICWVALAIIGLAYAVASTWGTGLVVRGVPVLLHDTSAPPERWPRVSLIVPARNEVETLAPAIRSRLAEGYPSLEVVLVDDRSTDGTGAVVDAIAAEDPRVRPVHVTSLPRAGWASFTQCVRACASRPASGCSSATPTSISLRAPSVAR